ncbi:dienelactone hydrolase [Aphanothece hegewaldii CCALA 016]|uniref:Dienelactone hydrolase n=2 Tax=Aphanothece TaxID=1121 RepID=A0A2T1LUG2_9CHRO|nr:alpha/beta hydrolase [Aphanothece hegewaldii]PSF35050.1 dienelactone hydrolase [Aphanothece hegewaldii CCALA 016]
MLLKRLNFSIRLLTVSLLCSLAPSLPVKAAEQIYLTYGPIYWSVKIASLETFAKDGTINQDLRTYLRGTTPEQQAQFREALLKRVDINPVMLSRFFNTEIGEDILTRIGKGITIEGNLNGKYALRAAIVQAALDPEGLTMLNILRKLPTDMELQGEVLLGLSQEIDKVIKATIAYSEAMANLSAKEKEAETPVDFTQLPDIRQPGNYGFQKEILALTDSNRNRSFYVILYKPQRWRTGKTPVVIISHGLASNPESFEDAAQQLASYGYVVALPQHPDSDTKQAKAFIEGYSSEVFDVQEFINRPKDISFVIDELERRNQVEFGGRLDLENVGVAGHSFGGYTALAVAGAIIDFDYLQKTCDRLYGGLNTSLLLQCRALSLPRQTYNFRDPRVKAVIAGNPVNSAIFGQKGLSQIQIPIFFISGNYDPATPAVFEQLRSFVWLNTPNKYLALAEGQAHIDFSKLDAGMTQMLDSVPNMTLPEPILLKSYLYPTFLSFFEVYLTNNLQYRPYLNASYYDYLSQKQNFKIYMISAASESALKQDIENFRTKVGALSP